jgi:hypothetical protein
MNRMERLTEKLNHCGYDAELVTVYKNNQPKQGITIKESASCPVIYEEMLDWEKENLVEQVVDLHNKYKQEFDISDINTKEFALSHAVLAVCRKDWNTEMLEKTPHWAIGETDLEYYIRIPIDKEKVFKPTFSYIEGIGITPWELFDAAKKNGRYSIRNINEVMAEMMGIDSNDLPAMPMNVLSNKEGFYGAAGIHDATLLNECMRKFDAKRLYIIPSSIHEMLCIPDSMVSAEELQIMIGDVNQQCVEVHDRLSDHAYVYDGITIKNA